MLKLLQGVYFLVLVELFYVFDLLTALKCTWGVPYFLDTMSFEVVSLVGVSGCTAVICGSLPV